MSNETALIYIDREQCHEMPVLVTGTVFGDAVNNIKAIAKGDCLHDYHANVVLFPKGSEIILTHEEICRAEEAILREYEESEESFVHGLREDLHLESYYFNA